MRQTLLAMVALMMATFMSYNQMQANVRTQSQMVEAEMREMATGIAMQTIEVVRARAFDANTIDTPKDEITDPSTDLTSPPFSQGNDCEAFGGPDTCDDVDDFHEMDPATISFQTPDGDFDFKVEIEVRYVSDAMVPVSTPTFRKEVIIEVQDTHSNRDPYLSQPITFSEVLTFY